MAALNRRRRYVRSPIPTGPITTGMLGILKWVGELGLASLPQLARLSERSAKGTRRLLRTLFDMGLVDVIPLSRSSLAGPQLLDSPDLLYGSAPNLYRLTPSGRAVLDDLGLLSAPVAPLEKGPRTSFFLAHTLAVSEMRVYLELSARITPGHCLKRWETGTLKASDGRELHLPHSVRPDAWFVYQTSRHVLVGFLEVDRSTERGAFRWKQKLTGYEALFAHGLVKDVTGYGNARLLITVPDFRRVESLSELIAKQGAAHVQNKVWLTRHSSLLTPGLEVPQWTRPGESLIHPLIPGELVREVHPAQVTVRAAGANSREPVKGETR